MIPGRQILLFVLLTVSVVGTAQIRLAPKIGYTYQQISFVEGGVLIYKDIGGTGIFNLQAGFAGLYVGGEYRSSRAGNDLGGIRIGAEAHYALFCARTGATFLNDFHGQRSWQFSGEAGLSFLGWFYVMAGYNKTLTSNPFVDLTGFKLSAGINFTFWHQVVSD